MSNLLLNHEVNHDQYKAGGLAFALIKKNIEASFLFFSLLDHDTSKTFLYINYNFLKKTCWTLLQNDVVHPTHELLAAITLLSYPSPRLMVSLEFSIFGVVNTHT